jgi:hypothetical protein
VRTLLAVFCIAVILAGCGMFGDAKPVISEAPASCKSADPVTKVVAIDAICAEAFDVINQANVLLIATDRAITDRVNSGIWTRDQAIPFFQRTSRLGEQVDQAERFFSAGTYTSAKAQADATKTLLLIIQKEVAAAAAKKSEVDPQLNFMIGASA